MLSKLLLIILFLAIPTAAYADGWILWAHTESLLPGTLERSTNFTPENYIHGFTSLELCKVESGKQANRSYQSTKEMVSHMEGSMMVGR